MRHDPGPSDAPRKGDLHEGKIRCHDCGLFFFSPDGFELCDSCDAEELAFIINNIKRSKE